MPRPSHSAPPVGGPPTEAARPAIPHQQEESHDSPSRPPAMTNFLQLPSSEHVLLGQPRSGRHSPATLPRPETPAFRRHPAGGLPARVVHKPPRFASLAPRMLLYRSPANPEFLDRRELELGNWADLLREPAAAVAATPSSPHGQAARQPLSTLASCLPPNAP